MSAGRPLVSAARPLLRAGLILVLAASGLGAPGGRVEPSADGPAQAHRPPPLDAPGAALARLDSLMRQVSLEEARTRRSPRAEGSWARLARAWFQVGDHERAAAALEHARSLGAIHFETLLLLGRAARSEMRFPAAVEWLRRAARARPEDWEVREDLGLSLYLAGDLAGAADQWERASALAGSLSPERSPLIAALRQVAPGAYRISGAGHQRLPFVPYRRRLPAIEVTVNGRGPYLFQIGGGVSEVVIGLPLARELGLTMVAGGRAEGLEPESRAALEYAILDSLGLGETTVHRLPCGVSRNPALGGTPGDPASSGREASGILGFEVLRRFRFCLDHPGGALWLSPANDRGPAPWVKREDRIHELRAWLRGTHLIHAEARLGAGPPRPWVLETTGPGIGFTAPTSTLVESAVEVDTSRVLTGVSSEGEVGYYRVRPAPLCVGAACGDSISGAYGLFPPTLELNPNFRAAGIVSQGFLARYRYEVHVAQGAIRLIEPGRRDSTDDRR